MLITFFSSLDKIWFFDNISILYPFSRHLEVDHFKKTPIQVSMHLAGFTRAHPCVVIYARNNHDSSTTALSIDRTNVNVRRWRNI